MWGAIEILAGALSRATQTRARSRGAYVPLRTAATARAGRFRWFSLFILVIVVIAASADAQGAPRSGKRH